MDADALRSLVREAVADAVARAARPCYTEAEAAALLGVGPHVLRDERLRGRIGCSRIAGRRVRYTPADLDAYLASRRDS